MPFHATWLYELHATPIYGDRPQAIINRQGVDKSDVVIAVFGTKLGTPTGVDVSGTVEEIKRAHELGKPVHVYFSSADIPHDTDPKGLAALREFKEAFRGLYSTYSDPADLARQVRDALEYDLDAFDAVPAPPHLLAPSWASPTATRPSSRALTRTGR